MVTFVLIRIQNGGVLDFGSPLHPDFFPELLCFLFKSGVARVILQAMVLSC